MARAEDDEAEAESLYSRVIDLNKELGDAVTESIAVFNVGLLYEDQGRLDKVFPFFEQAVKAAEQAGMPEAENRRRALERVREKPKDDG